MLTHNTSLPFPFFSRCITVVHRVCSVKGGQCTTQCATGYTPSTAQLGCSRGHWGGSLQIMNIFHFWAVQTLQIYVMFKRFPLDGELFGLVISWPLFNPSRTKYVISCVKLFFFEPHVLDDLVSVVSVSEKKSSLRSRPCEKSPVRTTES